MIQNTGSHISYPPVENSFKITCIIAISAIFIIVNMKFTLYNRLDIISNVLFVVMDVVLASEPPNKPVKYLITMIT